MTTSNTQRIVDLPGHHPARVDANIVSCVRVDTNEHGAPFVVIHTNQGYGFGLHPDANQSVNDFYSEVVDALWPKKTRRTPA